jgi:PTS system N-acetylglucosamine-specific IIA component
VSTVEESARANTGPAGADQEAGTPEAGPLVVAAPLAGTAVGLEAVPDPVFAGAMVGPGLAVDPDRSPATVVSPVAGTLVKLKPHAFVVTDAGGRGVLVHLGIDTVTLDGEGFTLIAAEGDTVGAGTPVVAWDPAAVEATGRSPICPVIALDAAPEAVTALADGRVAPGGPLFRWS